MPLAKREITPKAISRRPKSWGVTESGQEILLKGEYDLTAVSNITLCSALQQLAAVLIAAHDLSIDLHGQLTEIVGKTKTLSSRLKSLEIKVTNHNPRTIPVRECPSNFCKVK